MQRIDLHRGDEANTNGGDDGGGGLAAATPVTAWLPDLLYTGGGGRFQRNLALVCDGRGQIKSISAETDGANEVIRLPRRAALPGLVNAHSHAFQRVIRGRTERRSVAGGGDSFWTWREMMYRAAARLGPDEIYDASRMAFLEMVAGGITAVGEFHYLHHTPQGGTYSDPNLLAKQVIAAARDVGLRIALLRVAYARSGHHTPRDERQARFIESDPQIFLRRIEELAHDLAPDITAGRAWVGVAPHSVRAVPLDYLRAVSDFAAARGLPLHMHVAEQPAEVAACLAEYGRTPISLLAGEGLLSSRFTGVHAIHITPDEVAALGAARARVCACPTTERNLGDGIVPADQLLGAGVPLALGTDSHAQIDLLEDARALEYHLRLRHLARAVLAPAAAAAATNASPAHEEGTGRGNASALAARLFDCATVSGARAIGATGGELAPGRPADFFTVDLDDPSIAGADGDDELLSVILFSLARTAIREVVIGGRAIVAEGHHGGAAEIVSRFAALQRKLWGGRNDDL